MRKDHKQKHWGADRIQIPTDAMEELDSVHNISTIINTRKAEERPMGEDDPPNTEIELRVLCFRTSRLSIHWQVR